MVVALLIVVMSLAHRLSYFCTRHESRYSVEDRARPHFDLFNLAKFQCCSLVTWILAPATKPLGFARRHCEIATHWLISGSHAAIAAADSAPGSGCFPDPNEKEKESQIDRPVAHQSDAGYRRGRVYIGNQGLLVK